MRALIYVKAPTSLYIEIFSIDKYGNKMKKNTYLFLLLSFFMSFFISKSYAKENIVESLMETVIEKNLPYLLYEHTDKQWDMGLYSLKIERLGKSNLVSTNTHINLSIPVKATVPDSVKCICPTAVVASTPVKA